MLDPNDGLQNAYDELGNTLMERVANNPGAVQVLTPSEAELLFRATYQRTLTMPRNAIFDTSIAGVYDTWLYGPPMSGAKFNIYGTIAEGGHINYIAVGMLAAHAGPNGYQMIGPAVFGHNVGQVFGLNAPTGSEGPRNFRDIGPSMQWALLGARYYNNNVEATLYRAGP